MKKIFTLFIFSVLIVSCSEEGFRDPHYNNLGGRFRASGYESGPGFAFTHNAVDTIYPESGTGGVQEILYLEGSEYVVSLQDGHIVYVNGKTPGWKQKPAEGFTLASAMAADSAKNIYAIGMNGNLYSYDIDGNLRWNVEFPGERPKFPLYSDLLVTNSGLYAASSSGTIARFSLDGKLLNQYWTILAFTEYFSADEDGNIFATASESVFGGTDSLLIFSEKLEKTAGLEMENFRSVNGPAYHDGKIVFGGITGTGNEKSGKIILADKSGKIKKEAEIPFFPRFVSIDNEGWIYVSAFTMGFGSAGGGIYKFNNELEQGWDLFIEAAVVSPVMIGRNIVAVAVMAPEGAGAYYVDKERGMVVKTISLTEQPVLNMKPVMSPAGYMSFTGSDALYVVQISETQMDRMLPY